MSLAVRIRRFCGGLLLLAAGPALAALPSAAVYYGSEPPIELLSQFDWAVVDADQLGSAGPQALQARGSEVFAYLSVGEASEAALAAAGLGGEAVRSRNPQWHTAVLDLTAAVWRDHLLQRADQLWARGYRGLFLDTLDSYRLFATTDTAAQAQQQALVELIGQLHARHPGIRLLLNRGFEVLDRVQGQVAGVAAESLFQSWEPASGRYREVPEDERRALLAQLQRVRDQFRLPVVVIDYLPAAAREQARALAGRIAALGFVPWVSTGALDAMGVGLIEAMPRRVLMLYAGGGPGSDLAYAAVHAYAAMPLEYLGYTPEYRELHEPLPGGELRGRYAGIVAWLAGEAPEPERLGAWIEHAMDGGVPVAWLGSFGLPGNTALLRKLGLRPVEDLAAQSFKVVGRDRMTGFEGFPEVPPISYGGFRATRPDVTEHLLVEDAAGTRFASVLTAPWGGVALAPWLLEQVHEGGRALGDDAIRPGGDEWRERWILDPFEFFRVALQLPAMPVPDATTENGNRILTVHIDGDGLVNRSTLPGNPYAGQVVLDRLLKRHPLPTTVSVIESEVSPEGLYPADAPEAEAIARRIFRLPQVEIASHTYSHPFDWLSEREGEVPGGSNVAPPGYRYSAAREIDGSVAYIDRRLAPPGKRTQVLLWSGNALPPESALQRVEALGLVNLNGGNSSRSLADNTLASVSPMTRSLHGHVQVYAPVTNENVYTRGYSDPLWGFRRAIQTFELTDLPRRLKPMSIYYHFFSGGHGGSVAALERVYDYAESRPSLPMHASQYVRTVLGFADVGIARRLDGGWQIRNADALRTLRLPATLGWPDWQASTGIAGLAELPQGRYVALSGSPRAELRLSATRVDAPALAAANGRIVDWRREAGSLHFRLRGEVPLRLSFDGVGQRCTVRAPNARMTRDGARLSLVYRGMDTGDAAILCQ